MDIVIIDTFAYVERNTISAYVLKSEKNAVVDPGTAKGSEILVEKFRKVAGNNAEYVATTHVHLDHGGGSSSVARMLEAKILVHPKGVKHMINPERLWEASKQVLGDVAELYGKPEPADESRILAVDDGQSFDLGSDTLIAYHVPGHAPHMVAYYLKDGGVLFPSDAVGVYFNDVYPVTPPPFKVRTALESLERLMKLDVDRVAFTHFGFADEGVEVVRRSREKIEEWLEIAKDLVGAGLDGQEFVSEFLRRIEDDGLRELKKTNPVAYSFFTLSALGMLDCAKRESY